MKPITQCLLSLIICTLLTACDAIPQLPSNNGNAPLANIQSSNTPQATVETFLDAWSQEQFESMYQMLHPRSTEIYPQDEFLDLYASTHTDIGFGDVTYTIDTVETQGTSVAVTYNVTIDSATFGEIEDSNRTMRLVEDNGRWAIAWSPMDIINGMTANVRLDPNRISPPRGNILDRNGQPLVNQNGTTYGVILRLSDMLNEDDCTALLSRLMLRPLSYFEQLYIDFRAQDSAFFAGEIDGEILERNRADLDQICGTDIDIPLIGAKIQPRTGRTYFGNGAAAHVTGYISFIQDSGVYDTDYWLGRGYADGFVGYAGLEFTFQDELAGIATQSLRLIDSNGVVLRELGTATGQPSTSIASTIDRELQLDTARAFIDAWNYAEINWASRATGGAAVVMDVNTGAILAMFSFPTFDPAIWFPESNYYSTSTEFASAGAQINRAIAPGRVLPVGPATANRAVSEQYAPGSVFKIMSALAAADSETWQPEQEFFCDLTWDGSAQFGDTGGIRQDWRAVAERDAAGDITMSTALTTSCNPFFWQVGGLMYQQSNSLLSNYLLDWGFGRRTGIYGLTAEVEAAGTIPVPNDVTVAINNVIGQGDTQVTAVQMARLVSAVANGGTLYRPYLVSQVGGEPVEPIAEDQLNVSDVALQVVQQGMCNVPIDPDFGTSIRSFAENQVPPTYTSCGKTGTAQAGAAPNSWYVAYAPADNPQIAIAVVVPSSREGSEVATPITRRILDAYFDAPVAPYPEWWQGEYEPVTPPQGVGG